MEQSGIIDPLVDILNVKGYEFIDPRFTITGGFGIIHKIKN
jgi:hypothetical protein